MQDEYENQTEFNKVTPFGKNADGNPMMLIREELSNGWMEYLSINFINNGKD